MTWWFAPNPTRLGRLFIVAVLLFGPSIYLFVWCRMTTPRWYSGPLAARLGVLVAGSVADA
ncbi:MAG TPA: hypothetical protein VKB39_01630, partial [Candidatus Baltobacteraceae bacterium]|nr:hypothetical protein [Candidatus Baltobacteraceae bacterium]